MDLEIGAHNRADFLLVLLIKTPLTMMGNIYMVKQTAPLVNRKKKGGGLSRERQSFFFPLSPGIA